MKSIAAAFDFIGLTMPWSTRKLMSCAVTVVALLCAPFVAGASSTWSSSPGAVVDIYSHDGIYVIDIGIADAPCGSAGKFWWPASDSDAKDMYVMAMGAFLAGKRITVAHDAAAPSCAHNGNLITHMVISD